MSDSFLSQDEVDALLNGVGDDDDGDMALDIASAGEAATAQGSGSPEHPGTKAPTAQSYAPANLESLGRPRLARLDSLHDRFVGFFQTALLKFLGRHAEITISPVRQSRYKDFMDKQVLPTSLNLVRLEPLAGHGLFIMEPDLIFLIVDNLFGGEGRLHASETTRSFTIAEQRIAERLLSETLACYTRAWQEVHPLNLSVTRSEMHTKYMRLAADEDMITTISLTIQFGVSTGQLHICIPSMTLEPIRDLLLYEIRKAPQEVDRNWQLRLSRQLQSAEVEMVAQLCEIDVTLGDLMKMQPGDFIPFSMTETIVVHVDDVPIMACSYGLSNQQYAVRVETLLASPHAASGNRIAGSNARFNA